MNKDKDDHPKHLKPKSHKADPQLDELRQQLQDLTEALQRERADSINLRRRYEEQLSALSSIVKAEIIYKLLPVIDNFERSLKHIPEDLADNDYVAGIKAIVKQFETVLAELGVERINSVGEEFDPLVHEAVSMDEGDGTREIITDELQPGYKLNDRVIRHAKVKVKMSE